MNGIYECQFGMSKLVKYSYYQLFGHNVIFLSICVDLGSMNDVAMLLLGNNCNYCLGNSVSGEVM